jgi:hypothetical protein
VSDEIQIGDRLVVFNEYGLRVEGVVQAITDDHGTKMYKVASKDFVLTVTKKQIVEVHK